MSSLRTEVEKQQDSDTSGRFWLLVLGGIVLAVLFPPALGLLLVGALVVAVVVVGVRAWRKPPEAGFATRRDWHDTEN